MRIITLMENTEGRPGCRFEHGLSLYVETAGHKLLFDSGASDAFLENARALGVDLSAVDTLVLSHGHYDHAGGIMAFAGVNSRAVIYMQEEAGGEYFRKDPGEPARYIGIDKSILKLPRVRLLGRNTKLDEELSVFMGVSGRREYSESNRVLVTQSGEGYTEDPWRHEEYLVLQTEGKRVLFTGCAHNGILNILDRFQELYGGAPDVVLGGFHFMKKTDYTEQEKNTILQVARELAGLPTVFYTGHCTGMAAYELMKPVMGEKLQLLHSAAEVF